MRQGGLRRFPCALQVHMFLATISAADAHNKGSLISYLVFTYLCGLVSPKRPTHDHAPL